MDARRFDLLTRGVARIGTRRALLRSLAVVVGGAVPAAASVRTVMADSEDDRTSVGSAGSDGTAGPECPAAPAGASTGSTTCPPCPPSGRPAREVTGAPPFPVFIVGGTCADPSSSRSFNLIDAGSDDANGDEVGADGAISVATSVTSIRVSLTDLLDEPHAVIVRAGTTDDELIACGEVGGMRMGNTIALGLQERNGSGFAGIAQLAGDEDQTRVSIFVARDLFDQSSTWEGLVVVTTEGVNLRSRASENSAIVSVLAAGTVLTVTAEADGNWLPVVVDDTGDEGFVSADYVEEQ